MPEYLAPAVYVEETSFRSKSIEGVSTSTTAFIGPTLKGPTSGTPEIVTSFGDFERIYGGFGNLNFTGGTSVNYVAHAVKNYFDNGGSRLFVARTFLESGGNGLAGSVMLGDGTDLDNQIQLVSRTPGAVGSGSVTISSVETDVADSALTAAVLAKATNGTLLLDGTTVYIKSGDSWLDSTDTALAAPTGSNASLITLNVLTRDADGEENNYESLGFSSTHPRYIGDVLSVNPTRRIDQLQNNFAVDVGDSVTAYRLYDIISGELGSASSFTTALTGGNDGAEPNGDAYADPLEAISRIDDVSIVATPGSSSYSAAVAIQEALLSHVEARRAYRFAVLDVPADQTPNQAIAYKSVIDSSYAGLYHPWVVVENPLARPDNAGIPKEVALPPSGFVCGIFARNDNTKGVAKSPANEVIRGALRFQTDISFGEQELLNPRGINCLRFFPGRGNRLWGARTASSDPEWKYVGVRRYFLYLEHSIDRSTQWSVFENNGPVLWANIRESVSSFLYNEWRNNSLLGSTPEEAFFVRCDRTTMTQNDLDNGRLICLIGVAVLKPAEFVVFRIGQKTADSRD